MGNVAVRVRKGALAWYGEAKVPVTLPGGEVLTHQVLTRWSNIEVSYDDGLYRPLQPGEEPPDYVRGLWRSADGDKVFVAISREEMGEMTRQMGRTTLLGALIDRVR